MNEQYAEAGVKREKSAGSIIFRVFTILLAIVAFLYSYISTIMLIVAILSIVLAIFTFSRTNVEYEYIFCDGQLDFDKIMGNAKRKTKLRIQFEQVEVLAPVGSTALDGYKNVSMPVKDFSSKKKDAKLYVIILREGERKTKILFEPNENMINSIKIKNHRKVFEY